MDVDAQVFNYGWYSSSGVSEIEEEDSDSQLHNRNHDEPMTMATTTGDVQEHEGEEDNNIVYIAVGKGDTSMGALSWTLNNLPTHHSETILYLIHVFPEIKYIPNPLGAGMIPKNQVSPEEVESYVARERGKRRELLQRFLQLCSASKVKVDTILIESDLIAKAILDLIPILEIRNLVMGANKFHLRKSSRSRKGSGIVDQILQNAPQSCKVKIICEGKEVNEQMMGGSPSPQPQEPNPPPRPGASANDTPIPMTRNKQEHKQNDSISCICFKAKFK